MLSTVHLSLDWYERIARLSVGVVSIDEGDKVAPLTSGGSASSGGLTLDGLLSPGRYAVRVAGGAPTLYRLHVRHRLAALGEDPFEPNDTFDTAVGLRFEAAQGAVDGARSSGSSGPARSMPPCTSPAAPSASRR